MTPRFLAALLLVTLTGFISLSYEICWVRLYSFVSASRAWAFGAMLGTYAILMLIGAFFIAVGCLASAMTSSQIIAGIVTVGLLVIHHFLGYVTVIWGGSFAGARLFDHISSQQHLHFFAKGLIDIRNFVYFTTGTALFLFLSVVLVQSRRWR